MELPAEFTRGADGALRFNGRPARWHDVVASGNKRALAAFNQYRADTVQRLMDAVQHTCPACVARSVGSTNLTSDLDVTVSGPDTARFVAEFNRRFRAEFGAESGDVFDTQVYGASFVGPGRATSHAYVPVRVDGADFRALAPFQNEQVRADDEYNHHVWAACKLALYASAPELDLLGARLPCWRRTGARSVRLWRPRTASTSRRCRS